MIEVWDSIARTLMALALVLLLMGAVAWVARRVLAHRGAAPGQVVHHQPVVGVDFHIGAIGHGLARQGQTLGQGEQGFLVVGHGHRNDHAVKHACGATHNVLVT